MCKIKVFGPSRTRLFRERFGGDFFANLDPQIGPKSTPGGVLGPLGGVQGRLGASWRRLGGVLRGLGGLLDRLGAVLELSWAL